ncbi:response regulator transcription factor [Sphaerochaeta sp.]|jgi:DNA-binding NarL/FixJ family response regulator|uniref:response regulator transcription factor n=1 Tax=Sphaerochaeta sp. TaxID=1972642 RepID=UPI002FC62D75
MIRVVLVDDHAIIREGMKALLAHDPEIVVMGEAGTVDEAECLLPLMEESDVLVLDMLLEQQTDGLDIIQKACRKEQHPSILVVSMFTNADLVKRCLVMGAKGYVTKADATRYFVQAIHAVARKKTFVSPSLLASALLVDPSDEEDPTWETLTKRERDILELLGKGYPSRRISAQLAISVSTVGTHMENIKSKLHLSDKNALITYATRRESEKEEKRKLFSPA